MDIYINRYVDINIQNLSKYLDSKKSGRTCQSCHCSVTQSRLTLCDPKDCSMPGLSFTISRSLLKLISIESVMPSNHLTLFSPLLLLPSIFPSISVFSNESVLAIRCWSIGASATVLPMNTQDWFPLGLTGLISMQFKGLSSLLQHQFKSINSLALSLLYGSPFTSIYDSWKNHSFDYMDLCWQSDVSAF